MTYRQLIREMQNRSDIELDDDIYVIVDGEVRQVRGTKEVDGDLAEAEDLPEDSVILYVK
jgi:ribosome-associated protein YbcJ (S4-like RNA binding protein)